MSRKASLVWRVVIVAAACASENPKAFPGAVRDSAGIRVSECGASRDEPPLPWSIAETPDAVIGARGGREHELSGVVGAVRLTDGHIVVANATPPELRVYDATGRFVRTIGREGPGPGEFRAIRSLQRFTGDSLVVFDSRLRRISLFGADGGAGRIIPVTGRPRDTMPGLAWVVGLLPDGTYLVYGERGMSDRAGIVNLPRRLARVWPSGDSAVELGIFSGDDWRFIPRPGGAVGFDNNPLFGRKTRFLIGRDAFHVAYNAHGEIRRYDLTGTLRAIHRLRRDPYRLTEEDFDWVIDSIGRTNPDAADATRRIWRDEIAAYSTLPVYGAAILDADENVWVRQYDPPGRDRPEWFVFASDGFCLGTVTVPASLEILAIGADHLLGVSHGPLGVEHVVLHRLIRTTGH